jgi:hypothetical protein
MCMMCEGFTLEEMLDHDLELIEPDRERTDAELDRVHCAEPNSSLRRPPGVAREEPRPVQDRVSDLLEQRRRVRPGRSGDDQLRMIMDRFGVLLSRFPLLRFDPIIDFDAATHIDRSCRRVGITPRGFVDCMIASVAARNDATLLTVDSDVVRIAEVVGIPVEAG